MRPPHRHERLALARRLLFAGVWLGIWQLASAAFGSALILPGPAQVCVRLGELATTFAFWRGVASTLVRAAAGFACAFASAVVLGASGVRWPVVDDLLRPPLAFLKSAPIVCIIVLLLVWVGSRGVPAVAAFVAAFPVTYFSMREGLASVDGRMDELLAVFRVGAARRVLSLVWPSVVPFLASTGEASCSMAFKAAVAAELIGTPLGSVGERVYQAKLLLETADVLAWTAATVLLASVLSRLFVASLRASAPLSAHVATMLRPRGGRPVAMRGAGPTAIELRGVAASYGDRTVFSGLSHRFDVGSRTVVVDASGAGKTTLLRVLLGLVAPAAGQVVAPVASAVFQETRLFETLSAADNVALASTATPEEIDSALGQVLGDVDATAPVSVLSGGQRRRVELVRAFLADSQAVLLDEPFASLDAGSRDVCCQFVLERLQGRTLVVASHDEEDARLLAADEVELFA